MRSILADTGPLVALFKKEDRHHKAAVRWAEANRVRLLTTWPVVTEACHFLALSGRRGLFQFIERGGITVADIGMADLKGFTEVMSRYSDRSVDLADASLVLLAERLGNNEIITIDRTDFSVYRLGRNRHFEIIFP
ncbi:MAG: type II toxin-antitoxin system VapC family toxin [Burkholderiales bacterium]